jgi:DNA gyrase subunit A
MLLRLNEGERVNSCFPVVDDQGEAGPEAGATHTAATEPTTGSGTDTDG